jgi:predicted ABC-type ATPase
MPRRVVASPNGADKTTLALTRSAERVPVVNPDMIAGLLPRIVGKLDGRENFAIETTLAGHTPLKLMRDAKAADYKVTLVYIGLASATLSASRVLSRVRRGGHPVSLQHVERRYPDTISKLRTAIGIADRTYVFDNSGARRSLLLNHDRGRNKFVAAAMPVWAQAALHGIV